MDLLLPVVYWLDLMFVHPILNVCWLNASFGVQTSILAVGRIRNIITCA